MLDTVETPPRPGPADLVNVLGGARAVADRINTLRDKYDATVKRSISDRAVYDWTRQKFPMGWRQWVLAAALDMGLTEGEAIDLCPDLLPAVTLARFIVSRMRENAA